MSRTEMLHTKNGKVTPEQIKKTLYGAKTTQNAVSLPAIQRYVDRLNAGEKAPPIKMDSNVIVDGNHRYIAGKVQGTLPEVQAGTMAPSKASQPNAECYLS